MTPKPPTPAQLAALRRLGYTGKTPTSRADAAYRIDLIKTETATDYGTTRSGRSRHLASERLVAALRLLGYQGPSDITAGEAVRLYSYLQTTSTG